VKNVKTEVVTDRSIRRNRTLEENSERRENDKETKRRQTATRQER